MADVFTAVQNGHILEAGQKVCQIKEGHDVNDVILSLFLRSECCTR